MNYIFYGISAIYIVSYNGTQEEANQNFRFKNCWKLMFNCLRKNQNKQNNRNDFSSLEKHLLLLDLIRGDYENLWLGVNKGETIGRVQVAAHCSSSFVGIAIPTCLGIVSVCLHYKRRAEVLQQWEWNLQSLKNVLSRIFQKKMLTLKVTALKDY